MSTIIVAALEARLTALDPYDPATSTTVVFSSYQTWVRRTTTELDVDGNVIPPTPRTRRTSRQPAVNPQAVEDEYDEDHVTDHQPHDQPDD